MLIYLIRHGVTVCNEQHRYQGVTDLPLSQRGRAMLEQADLSPDKVYVSPLIRAEETAELLFPCARLVPVSQLREMDFGVFEGRSAQEMENDRDYRAWVDCGCSSRCPGGETRAEFSRRVCAAFVQLLEQAQKAGEKQLVIVAHGGTQMSVLEAYGRPERPYYLWQSGNGGGFVLDDALWAQEGVLRLVEEVSYSRSVP